MCIEALCPCCMRDLYKHFKTGHTKNVGNDLNQCPLIHNQKIFQNKKNQ